MNDREFNRIFCGFWASYFIIIGIIVILYIIAVRG